MVFGVVKVSMMDTSGDREESSHRVLAVPMSWTTRLSPTNAEPANPDHHSHVTVAPAPPIPTFLGLGAVHCFGLLLFENDVCCVVIEFKQCELLFSLVVFTL